MAGFTVLDQGVRQSSQKYCAQGGRVDEWDESENESHKFITVPVDLLARFFQYGLDSVKFIACGTGDATVFFAVDAGQSQSICVRYGAISRLRAFTLQLFFVYAGVLFDTVPDGRHMRTQKKHSQLRRQSHL